MRKRIVIAITAALPVLAIAGYAAASGQSELAEVRRVTARFHNVDAAKAAGYELGYVNGTGNRIITGCIAHPTAGAMGYHYFNKELIDDLVVDVSKPEGLVYAPLGTGTQARRRRVRRPGCRLEPARGVRAADRARSGDGDSRPGGGLVHPAFLGLEHEPGRDLCPLEPRGHLYIAGLVEPEERRVGPRLTLRGTGAPLPTYLVEAYTPPSRANQADRADRIARAAAALGREGIRSSIVARPSWPTTTRPSISSRRRPLRRSASSVAVRVSDASASSPPSRRDGVRRCALLSRLSVER